MNKFITKYRNETITFLSSVILGVIAHGFIFFNNITLHDNTYNFYMGGTYTSGRWMLAKLLRLSQVLFETNYLHYSLPWFIGFVTIFCIGCSAAVVMRLLHVKNPYLCAAFGAIMVTFPYVISLFGYMFTAGMYAVGTLMGILGVSCICKVGSLSGRSRNFFCLAMGIILQACSVGVYQANIGVITSLTILVFIRQLDEAEKVEWKSTAKNILYYFFETIVYMAVYLIANAYFLRKVNAVLSNYRGIGNGIGTDLGTYLERIKNAYITFFKPSANGMSNLYVGGTDRFYYLCLLIVCMFCCIKLYQMRKNLVKTICFLLVLIILPLCMNSAFLMVSEDVYSLMVQGEIMLYALFVYLCDKAEIKWKKQGTVITVIVMMLMVIGFSRYSNLCYIKADYIQKASTAYFSRMITRIESCDEYQSDMPVVFIGELPTIDTNVFLYPEFTGIELYPFWLNTMINNYNWYDFMKSSCGYNPIRLDAADFVTNSEVKEMSIYPSDNSIKIINHTVIIKLSDSF